MATKKEDVLKGVKLLYTSFVVIGTALGAFISYFTGVKDVSQLVLSGVFGLIMGIGFSLFVHGIIIIAKK